MVSYPIRHYFLVTLLLLSVYFFSINAETGLIYLLFFLFSALTLNLLQSVFYKGAFFIILFAVTAGYFIRPLILVNHPDLFMYPKIASSTNVETINEALYYALTNVIFWGSAFLITIKSIPDKIITSTKNNNFMLSNFYIINIIIIALTAVRLTLAIFSNVGIKGEGDVDTTYAFMFRLISPEMSFVVSYIYLSKYWKRLSFRKRIIVLSMIIMTSYSVFITGSKTFVAIFGLCFFFDFIYREKKIKLITFSLLTSIGLILIALSFIIAAAVKFSGSGSIFAKAKSFANSGTLLSISNDVTQRMIGLDGQIATYIVNNQSNQKVKFEIERSFTPKEVILHALNIIVPKLQFTTAPSSGKLTSEYINGFSSDKVHGGSLGLFAGIFFMTGSKFFIFNIALGILMALCFIFVRRIKNDDLKFILFFVGSYFIIRLVLSGNFDLILGEFVTETILLFFYIKLISFIGAKY